MSATIKKPKLHPKTKSDTITKEDERQEESSDNAEEINEGELDDENMVDVDDIYEDQDEDENPRDLFENEEEPLSKEALEAYQAAQARAGVIYISRIPPGMSPNKVRHLMSAYGEVGRVFLQQEDPKRAYLRKKYTTTKKPQYTEGWVEFKSKKIARSVAEMLNAQPIGGKKGSRWREDVWTMKYLSRFKWGMLTEQIAHERAVHAARLRMELSQSKREQKHYLRQVEIGKSLEKREEKKRKREEAAAEGAGGVGLGKNIDTVQGETKRIKPSADGERSDKASKKHKHRAEGKERTGVPASSSTTTDRDIRTKEKDLDSVLGSIF